MTKNTSFFKTIKQKPLLIVIFLVVCLYSCNLHGAETACPEIVQEDVSSYIIGPGDKLEISIYRNSDAGSSPQVDTIGNITMPLLGDMKVSGLTTYQLRDKITEGLRKYIINPQVTVTVSAYQSQKITIMGEVESPSVLQIEKPMPISELISKVSGFTENANKDNITVLRKDGKGSRQIINVNVRKMLEEGDTTQNILICKDDIIYVSKDIRKITVLGEINTPGTISIGVRLGILEAIAKAGHFTTNANKNNIIIMGKDNKSPIRIVDYQQILDNRDLSKNLTLTDGEVVYVPRENKQVLIIGEVTNPGVISNDPQQTLLEAIAKAGHFTTNANKNNIIIMGKDNKSPMAGNFTTDANKNNIIIMGKDNKSPIRIVDYQQILDNRDLSKNLTLTDGEVVYVPRENKQVLIIGEVTNPGVISNDPQQTLLEAIAKAGNFTTDANKNNIIIMGKDNKSPIRIVDYQQILDNRDLSKNLTLTDGEVVYVPRENKQVLIIGEVTNPGVISNDPQQTLLEAIMRRGGFTTDGNKSKVFIIRGTTEKANIVSYNLKKLLKEGDVSQNILLQKGDIVYVPPTFIASTESVLNHIRSILSVALSAESAITFWPQTRQVLETGETTTTSGIVITPGQ